MKKIQTGSAPQIVQKMNELSIDIDIYDKLFSSMPLYERNSIFGISIEKDECDIYIEKMSEFYKILKIKDSTIFDIYEKVDENNIHQSLLISREKRNDEIYKLRMENNELNNMNINEKSEKKRIKRKKKIFRNNIRINYYQGFHIYESQLYAGENLKKLLKQII